MKVNLYPYNMWCLYAAIVVLLVFLVMTVKNLMPMVKALNEEKPGLESISKGVNNAKVKAEVSSAKINKTLSTVLKVLPIILVLKAIQSEYNKVDESGVEGYKKAAANYYRDKANAEYMKKGITALIKK